MTTHTLDSTRTVRDFAIEVPGATRLFERHGIDYCCGGGSSLEDACAARGVDISLVAAQLDELRDGTATSAPGESVADLGLVDLANHIVARHHAFTRDELLASASCSTRSARYTASGIRT